MGFTFSDRHIDDYYSRGVTVFRGILPATLLDELRAVTDQARELAREKSGPQAQRLQPVGAFDIDQKPFEEYAALPELRDAITRVLGVDTFRFGNTALMGVLLEPAELPWCTNWHRDWRDHNPGFSIEEWNDIFLDIEFMNQINCALYEDTSTWVVPGSHLRQNLERELERFPERPVPGPDLEGKSSGEREYLCREYCLSLPGAEQLTLNAGDFALYRASMWHLGNYVPYRKRATLHDAVLTPRSAAWRGRIIGGPQEPEPEGPINRRFVGISVPGGGEEYRQYQQKP